MSEGLNLQTSGRLINYDMPWNLMRVEQRIGRVDRIGATYKDITVSNYFYADTVEERSTRESPRTTATSPTSSATLLPCSPTSRRPSSNSPLGTPQTRTSPTRSRTSKTKSKTSTRAQSRRVTWVVTGSIGHIDPPPVLRGDIDLEALEKVLTENPLTAKLLTATDGPSKTYRLTPPAVPQAYSFATATGLVDPAGYRIDLDRASELLVTFDRDTADQSDREVTLLTYGAPELDAILPRPANQG